MAGNGKGFINEECGFVKIPYTPKSLEILLTNKCNLRCSYCSYFSSDSDVTVDLPADEWIRFFGELKQCAVFDVTLAGGEVLCRKDFREIVQGIVDNRMRFSVLTNATLMTEEIARFIAVTKRCNYIQVSVDGADATVHDATRGEGNFLKAVEGIRLLKKYHLLVIPRVTINRHNVRHLESIAKFLFEEIGLSQFSTNSVLHQGLCRYSGEELLLTIDARSFAMGELLRLNKKYNRRITAMAGPLWEAEAWLGFRQRQLQGERDKGSGGHLSRCREIFKSITVRSDGVMVPCAYLSHIELGRINKDPLREVWQHHPELNRLRLRQEISLSGFEFCRGCQYMPYCGGSCPAMAYHETGKDDRPSPGHCLNHFLKNGGTLPGG